MEYKKVRLGDYLLGYDEINKDGEFSEIDDLQGINNEKYFQGCQSNKNDIDLNRYRICRHGMFAYNKATSRNGEKISIAYRTDGDCLISPSYICFSIKDENVLMPEYLMLWFKRPEFDRYARFNSWGSATEFFTWEDFQEIEFDLPPIEEQQKIVRQYKTITDRIGVLEKINEKLTNFIVKYNGYFIKEHDKGEELGSLEQLCENIYSGGTPSTSEEEYWNGDLLWLSSGETSESYVVTTEKTITLKGVKNSSTKLAEKGSIVIASAGQGKTRGQTSYLLKDMYVNQSVIVLKPQKNCGAYIFSNLKGRYDELRTGSDLNAIRGSLTTTEVKAFPIYIPTKNEMQEYNEKIQPILDCIDAQIKEIYELFLMKERFIEKHI